MSRLLLFLRVLPLPCPRHFLPFARAPQIPRLRARVLFHGGAPAVVPARGLAGGLGGLGGSGGNISAEIVTRIYLFTLWGRILGEKILSSISFSCISTHNRHNQITNKMYEYVRRILTSSSSSSSESTGGGGGGALFFFESAFATGGAAATSSTCFFESVLAGAGGAAAVGASSRALREETFATGGAGGGPDSPVPSGASAAGSAEKKINVIYHSVCILVYDKEMVKCGDLTASTGQSPLFFSLENDPPQSSPAATAGAGGGAGASTGACACGGVSTGACA